MQSDFWSNVGMLAVLAISFSVLVGLLGRPLASVLQSLSRRLRRSPIGGLVPLALVGALLAYGGTKPPDPPDPPDPPAPQTNAVPEAVAGLVYTGGVQTGVVANAGCAVTGNAATDAGAYAATAKLLEGYVWPDGTSSDRTVAWEIARATYDLGGVTLTNATYVADGRPHSLAVTGELPDGVTVTYEGNGQTEPGTYEVTARFAGDAKNYEPIASLTATLTIEAAPEPPERDELRAGVALDERQSAMFAQYAGFGAKGLPKGLKWNKKTGVLSGTPTQPGIFDVTFSKGADKIVEELTVGHYVDPEIPISEAYGPCSVGTVVCEELTAAIGCKAKGLPSGLKFSAKALTDKTCGEVPAGALYGVPTKAGAYTVVFTKKVGKTTHTASATVVVAALATDVQGTFDGGSDAGQATVTVAKNGKLGGTWRTGGKKYKIAAPAFALWDGETGEYAALAAFTAGKGDAFAAEIRVSAGKMSACLADGGELLFEAWQNQWKTTRKDEAKLLKGWEPEPRPVEGGQLSFKVGANGTVKVTGEFVTGFDEKKGRAVIYKTSGSATLIPTEIAGTYVLFVSLPPKQGKFDGFGGRVTLTGE